VRVNWCASCGGGANFGDQLGPILLRHYGFKVVWSRPAGAELVTVGSILSKVPNGWRGTVLGTGFIRPFMRKDLRRARVLAVRGIGTRDACKLPVSTPLGDMGILCVDLPRKATDPVGELVVPHYVDHDIVARHPDATVVPITAKPDVLMGAIAAADVVYSSSLHALVAADALGIPHVLEIHPNVHGGIFKFNDYASAFDERIRPGRARLTDRTAMAERQAEMRMLVERLR